MKAKFRVSGVGKLRKRFVDKRRQATDSSVAVGYTANYAFFVHEMAGANFKRPGARAKFLEHPAREMMEKGEIGRHVNAVMSKGGTLQQGLFTAGLALQAASQTIVPIDTGNLRASAFTRIER